RARREAARRHARDLEQARPGARTDGGLPGCEGGARQVRRAREQGRGEQRAAMRIVSRSWWSFGFALLCAACSHDEPKPATTPGSGAQPLHLTDVTAGSGLDMTQTCG